MSIRQKIEARLELAMQIPDWFKEMTKEQQKDYLEKHPNSKLAKGLAGKSADKDSGKKEGLQKEDVEKLLKKAGWEKSGNLYTLEVRNMDGASLDVSLRTGEIWLTLDPELSIPIQTGNKPITENEIKEAVDEIEDELDMDNIGFLKLIKKFSGSKAAQREVMLKINQMVEAVNKMKK